MHDQPSVTELVQAVKNFIDNTAAPNLTGHPAFHARVASNALATVLRDLESRAGNDADERSRLEALLGRNDGASLDSLNRDLCDRIRKGELDLGTDGLMAHLRQTAIDQVEVDQPRYSGLRTAKSRS